MNRKELIEAIKEVSAERKKIVAEAQFFEYIQNRKKAHELWKRATELKKKQKQLKRDLDAL